MQDLDDESLHVRVKGTCIPVLEQCISGCSWRFARRFSVNQKPLFKSEFPRKLLDAS